MSNVVGIHYHLIAYICGPADARPSPFQAWATFQQIFDRRPDKCRFAVVRGIPIILTDGEYAANPPEGPVVVWDMLDDKLIQAAQRWSGGAAFPTPVAIWTGDSEDGMVMKAMALFDKEV